MNENVRTDLCAQCCKHNEKGKPHSRNDKVAMSIDDSRGEDQSDKHRPPQPTPI